MRFILSYVLITIFFCFVSASPNDVERTDLQILEDARLDTVSTWDCILR